VAAVTSDSRSLTRHGQDRKADLLHHAEQLFAERGYEDTRMIDIAAAAGVAKGLVYWYFENKDTLFDEIVTDMGQRLRRAQGRAIAGIDDPLERLYVGTAESVRFVAGNYRLYGIISSQTKGDARLRETRSRSQRIQAGDAIALLAEGQERGVVRDDEDAAVLAHANAGVVYYFVLRHAEPGDGPALDLEEAAHAAARYVVRAVGASAPAIDRVLARRSRGAAVAPAG
jgi:AcrR family transcriptional regulator